MSGRRFNSIGFRSGHLRCRLLGRLIDELGRDIEKLAHAIVVPAAFFLDGLHLLIGRVLAGIGVLHIRVGVFDLLFSLAFAARCLLQEFFSSRIFWVR